MTLAKKLSEVSNECGFAQFDAKNDFHKYKYASAAGIIRMVNSALTARGIATTVQSELLHFERGHAVVRLTLGFTDGKDTLTTQGIGEGTDKGDKSVYKANTGAYKYALAHAFTMAWGAEDPEADASVDAPAPATKPAAKTKSSPAAKPKAKGGRKKKEPPKAPCTVADIEGAKSTEDLEKFKAMLVEFSTVAGAKNEDYAALKAAWRKRNQEI